VARVDVRERRPAEVLLHHLAHARRHGLAADQDHLVNLRGPQARDAHGALADVERALYERREQLIVLGARHRELEIDRRAVRAVRGLFHAHVRALGGRQLHLEPLARDAQPLVRLRIGAEIDAVLGEEGSRHAVGDQRVDVVAAEV
jgi:hypothetical protein